MYGQSEISERHRHRYEVNSNWVDKLTDAGLVISGSSPDGKLVEMVELPADKHPYFVACQFHPEFKSRPLDPHPLFEAFLRAANPINRAKPFIPAQQRVVIIGESASERDIEISMTMRDI